MTVTLKKPLTDAQLMALPHDGRRWEQVNGELKEMPTSAMHDVIIMILGALLMPHAKGRGYLTVGQAGFRMTGGNLRVPDLSFTRKERIPNVAAMRGFLPFAPDLCVEIISPSEDAADMVDKLNEYFASGAQQVWHVFPETQTVTVFASPTQSVTLTADSTLDGGTLLSGFSCTVSELFLLD